MQMDQGWAEWGWDTWGQFVAGIATESRVITKKSFCSVTLAPSWNPQSNKACAFAGVISPTGPRKKRGPKTWRQRRSKRWLESQIN